MAFQINEDPTCKTGYVPRGGALELWRCKHNEVIIAGPAELGRHEGLEFVAEELTTEGQEP